MGDTSRPTSHREIGRRFSRASDSYRVWAVPQRRVAGRFIDLFGHYFKNSSVLDVGAGVGLLSELLEPTAEKLFVCDLSFETLKKNPAAERRAFICNMERLPIKNSSVDWTVSSFALHWCDHRSAIREFFRVSKKGFAFTVPVEGSLEGLGFPFPRSEEILKLTEPTEWFVESVEIPFRGRDFLLFFKRTGTSFNPSKRLSAFEILREPSKVKFYGFKVLYLVKKF